MKTTAEIADPLFKQAKALAVKEGITFRILIEEGLQAAVEARTTKQAKPFRLRDASFRGVPGLQPGVKWSDIATMAYDDEGQSFRN